MSTDRVVVEAIGRDEDFQEMMTRVRGGLETLASDGYAAGGGVDAMAAATGRAGGGLSRMAVAGGAAILAVTAVTAAVVVLVPVMRDLVNAYREQELAETRVEASLRATGEAAGYTSEQLQRMAKDLQDTTRYSDETVLNLMAISSAFTNVRGDNFKRMTELTLDITEVVGTALGSSTENAKRLGRALDNPMKAFDTLRELGIEFSDITRKHIEDLTRQGKLEEAQNIVLTELEKRYGGVAKAMGGSYAGSVDRLANLWNDLKQNMGEAITKVFVPFLPTLEKWVKVLGTMSEGVIYLAEGVGSILKDAFQALTPELDITGESFVIWAARTGAALKNWRLYVQRSVFSATLTVVEFGMTVKYFFADLIPKHLAEGAAKIAVAFATLKKVMAGDLPVEDMNAALADLTSHFLSLPDFAGRALSDTEKQLKQKLEDLTKAIEKAKDDAEKAAQDKLDGPNMDPNHSSEYEPNPEEEKHKKAKKAADEYRMSLDSIIGMHTRMQKAAAGLYSKEDREDIAKRRTTAFDPGPPGPSREEEARRRGDARFRDRRIQDHEDDPNLSDEENRKNRERTERLNEEARRSRDMQAKEEMARKFAEGQEIARLNREHWAGPTQDGRPKPKPKGGTGNEASGVDSMIDSKKNIDWDDVAAKIDAVLAKRRGSGSLNDSDSVRRATPEEGEAAWKAGQAAGGVVSPEAIRRALEYNQKKAEGNKELPSLIRFGISVLEGMATSNKGIAASLGQGKMMGDNAIRRRFK